MTIAIVLALIRNLLPPALLSIGLVTLAAATWAGPAMVGDILWPTVAGGLWGAALLWVVVTGGLGRLRKRLVSRPWLLLPSAALFGAAAAGRASYGAGALALAATVVVAASARPRIAAPGLALFVVLIVVPVEGFLAWSRSSTAAARHPLTSRLSRIMYLRFCVMPQLSRECSEFDPELLYRLRPGGCRFENEEYETTIGVNSLGVRGTEAELVAPEIIVLGDSYSMGWGVDDDQTYAAVLARRTGRRTLNLAIASYGTARQMAMLGRVDRSRAGTIILQYCTNDLEENRDYVERGFRAPPHTAGEHEDWISTYERYRNYYPGKLTFFALWRVWDGAKRLIRPRADRPRSAGEDARLVRRIIEHHADRIGDARLVVFGISDPGRKLDGFEANLRDELRDADLTLDVEVVEVERELGPDSFYDLDPHFNPAGHEATAALLEPHVAR